MRDNQFQTTKNQFLAATSFVRYPLSYDVWMTLDDSLKAAALYVNFYPQVILAWQHEKADFLEEEDLVSIIMQYLIKNVDKIKMDSKRYAQPYIYRVCANAIIGLRRPKKMCAYQDNTQSNIFTLDDGEHDLFDIIEDEHDCFRDAMFKEIISGMDDSMKEFVSHLIWGTKVTFSKRGQRNIMMEALKEKFSDFVERREDCKKMQGQEVKEDTNKRITTFGDIYAIDDSVASAVCTMSDGEQAVYYGEKQIIHDTKKVNVVFFGAKRDYIVPLEIAKKLEVTDLECY